MKGLLRYYKSITLINNELYRLFFIRLPEILLLLLMTYSISVASDKDKSVVSDKYLIINNKIIENITNYSIEKVLISIQDKRGIIFEIFTQLNKEPITATITADNWTAVVRKLLRDYNRIEFLNPDGSLRKVRIVDRIEEPMPMPPMQSVPDEEGIGSEIDSLTELPYLPPPPPPLDAHHFDYLQFIQGTLRRFPSCQNTKQNVS